MPLEDYSHRDGDGDSCVPLLRDVCALLRVVLSPGVFVFRLDASGRLLFFCAPLLYVCVLPRADVPVRVLSLYRLRGFCDLLLPCACAPLLCVYVLPRADVPVHVLFLCRLRGFCDLLLPYACAPLLCVYVLPRADVPVRVLSLYRLRDCAPLLCVCVLPRADVPVHVLFLC